MPSGTSYPHSTASVSTTAVFLCTVAAVDTQAIIKNRGPVTAYLGGSTVTADETSTGGYPLEPGEQVELPSCPTTVTGGLDIYAITAADTAYVSQINV